jgi:tetratricopeptide (TPR) repeat protein
VREQPTSARAHLLSAVAVDPRIGNDWLLLWHVEASLGLHDEAIRRLTHYARRFPDELDEMGLATLSNAVHLPRAGAASRIDLLQAVFDSGWAPHGEDMSFYWVELAQLRVDTDAVQQAAVAIERVTAPMALARLRSDKRFDPLVDASAPRFDVEHAAARQLAALRTRHAAEPHDLHVTSQLLDALLTVGEHQAVLDLTGELMAKVATGGVQADDLGGLEQLNWLRNQRATAFTRLGRFADALAEMQLAGALDEEGRANVSQMLNLAAYYAAMQRPDDALATLDKVGVMSGYGRMVQESVRLRAATARGDAALAAEALSYLRAHATEGPMVLITALVESGDEEAAATALIDMLASVDERDELLVWLQEFRERPPLPFEKMLEPRWDALRARSDVRAAIASVGRIQTYAIFGY